MGCFWGMGRLSSECSLIKCSLHPWLRGGSPEPMSVTVLLTTEWLKKDKFVIFRFWRSEVQKSRYQPGCISSGSSRGESISSPSLGSSGCLHPLAHVCITPTSASFVTSPLTLTFPPAYYKHLVITLGSPG